MELKHVRIRRRCKAVHLLFDRRLTFSKNSEWRIGKTPRAFTLAFGAACYGLVARFGRAVVPKRKRCGHRLNITRLGRRSAQLVCPAPMVRLSSLRET